MPPDPDEVQEAELTPEEHTSLTSRYGDKATVYEAGGRRWVFRRPSRAQWRAYKCAQNSLDPTTKADAGVDLARMCLAPFDPKGTVEQERADAVFPHRADAVSQYQPSRRCLDRRAAIAELHEFPWKSRPGDQFLAVLINTMFKFVADFRKAIENYLSLTF